MRRIISVKNILVNAKKNNKKIMIFGNGGSAAIASHVSVDLTKNASIRPVKMTPATRLLYVEVAEPDMHEPSGDFERLKTALQDQWEISDVELDFFQFSKTIERGASEG